MIPVKAILDYCKSAADLGGVTETVYYSYIIGGTKRHGYVYGGQGEKYTADLAEKWAASGRSIPSGRILKETKKHYFTVSCAKWYGRIVEDCSGMIVNAMRTVDPKYKDRNANTIISQCTQTGSIETMPEVPGIVLWKPGHIGVYIGNGWQIEARGTDYGVVKSKVSSQKWKKWGYLSGVDYGNSNAWIVKRVLKLSSPMQIGNDVKELQSRIIDYGIKKVLVKGELKLLVADGKFGEITDAALRMYQKSKGIKVDGKAGRETITALGGVWSK